MPSTWPSVDEATVDQIEEVTFRKAPRARDSEIRLYTHKCLQLESIILYYSWWQCWRRGATRAWGVFVNGMKRTLGEKNIPDQSISMASSLPECYGMAASLKCPGWWRTSWLHISEPWYTRASPLCLSKPLALTRLSRGWRITDIQKV